ncbi:zf-CCHC domain-containing protein [Tanacetum coccineum]
MKNVTILKEESIDSGFVRFNTIITSLKALDECFSSKNPVRKFLRAIHPKWRAKVMDFDIYKGKKERVNSIALKATKESSDAQTSTSESDDEEYVMAVRNFKKFFRRKGGFVRQPREEKKSFRKMDDKKGKSDRKCFRCGDPNHLIGECPKPSRNKSKETSQHDRLTYKSGFELIAFLDADHAGCLDTCKGTSCGIQFLSDKLVSWSSKKQDCTAMSTVDAGHPLPSHAIRFNTVAPSISLSNITSSRNR